jgi:hypothetical protein
MRDRHETAGVSGRCEREGVTHQKIPKRKRKAGRSPATFISVRETTESLSLSSKYSSRVKRVSSRAKKAARSYAWGG